MEIGVDDFSARLNIFTGDKGSRTDISEASEKYPYGYNIGGDVDKYRMGALSFGYRGMRIGLNSEAIRHATQNRFHNWIGDKAFKELETPSYLYYYWGTNNRYSLWY